MNSQNRLNFFVRITLQTFVNHFRANNSCFLSYNDLLTRLNKSLNTAKLHGDSEEESLCRRKIQILENCYSLFKPQNLGEKPQASKISENIDYEKYTPTQKIIDEILEKFSEEIWTDGKRTYDMSKLATSRNIPNIITPQGQVVPDVYFVEAKNPSIKTDDDVEIIKPRAFSMKDAEGNNIIITLLGTLYYNDGSVPNESINKYHISKTIDGVTNEYDVFSELIINSLSNNPEFCKVVAAELLSTYNLENSNANGYIGDITYIKNSGLKLVKNLCLMLSTNIK